MTRTWYFLCITTIASTYILNTWWKLIQWTSVNGWLAESEKPTISGTEATKKSEPLWDELFKNPEGHYHLQTDVYACITFPKEGHVCTVYITKSILKQLCLFTMSLNAFI